MRSLLISILSFGLAAHAAVTLVQVPDNQVITLEYAIYRDYPDSGVLNNWVGIWKADDRTQPLSDSYIARALYLNGEGHAFFQLPPGNYSAYLVSGFNKRSRHPYERETLVGPVPLTATQACRISCSEEYEWYGKGRWTRVTVSFCFEQHADETKITPVWRILPRYYWGLDWYDLGEGDYTAYPVSATASIAVQGDNGVSREYEQAIFDRVRRSGYWTPGSRHEKLPAGKYNVTVRYRQSGPYWESDTDMDETAQFTIKLAC
ncbi:hypothetical protein ED733_002170 [Metarhizium rileyi]|uniref:Uncharacterized protein n=1 Tax=Metarhizium rileyi (strain RCEF 4871) TaxID=1649241 RepID=A0A5C6G748_METRR|nr:hypothetical protein ED733_002170 [Metarhizium rileyi]